MAAMGGAEGLGRKGIAQIVKLCGSAIAAWTADIPDLVNAQIRHKSWDAFLAFRKKYPDAPNQLKNYCESNGINLCCISDDDYPPLLKEIDSPPMFFYYRGQLQPTANRIAIVGSRDATPYGETTALKIGEQLAAAGLTVVSGAARGIDSFALCGGALKAGRTVAVLGCGISIAFESGMQKIFSDISENGIVISEFNPKMPAAPWALATRNRIIAGLCQGVVVVEAALQSGTMITAKYAKSYGRDIFAVPGRLGDEKSVGCNELIRGGATLIRNARDVLDKYNIARKIYE